MRVTVNVLRYGFVTNRLESGTNLRYIKKHI